MHPKLSFAASAFALLAIPSLSAADATIYGKAHVSVDYVDADAGAAWSRPAGGAPSFDVMGFIHDANQALNDAGYVAALPPPRDLDTVVGDLLLCGRRRAGAVQPADGREQVELRRG